MYWALPSSLWLSNIPKLSKSDTELQISKLCIRRRRVPRLCVQTRTRNPANEGTVGTRSKAVPGIPPWPPPTRCQGAQPAPVSSSIRRWFLVKCQVEMTEDRRRQELAGSRMVPICIINRPGPALSGQKDNWDMLQANRVPPADPSAWGVWGAPKLLQGALHPLVPPTRNSTGQQRKLSFLYCWFLDTTSGAYQNPWRVC